jgi:hypothetical protein
MISNDARFNRWLVLLVMASFTVFATALVLRLGLGATSYDATNSAGKAMGFNDPLDAEHYVIMIRNFNPTELLQLEYTYEWVLLIASLFIAFIHRGSTFGMRRLCNAFAQAVCVGTRTFVNSMR